MDHKETDFNLRKQKVYSAKFTIVFTRFNDVGDFNYVTKDFVSKDAFSCNQQQIQSIAM